MSNCVLFDHFSLATVMDLCYFVEKIDRKIQMLNDIYGLRAIHSIRTE